jgi:hypothetical protein
MLNLDRLPGAAVICRDNASGRSFRLVVREIDNDPKYGWFVRLGFDDAPHDFSFVRQEIERTPPRSSPVESAQEMGRTIAEDC